MQGFFGKGSLSKGCPNVTKRKIPISVVYESQWKRRKMWMQSLNNLLETSKKSNQNPEDDVVVIDNKENCAEKMEVDNMKSGLLQNNSCMTEQKLTKTTKDNMVDIENEKSYAIEQNEIDIEKNRSQDQDLTKTQERASTTNGNQDNESSKNKSNEISEDNMVDINKKSNDVEVIDVDNEKNNSQDKSINGEEEPSKRCENGDNTDCTIKPVKSNNEKIEVDSEKNNLYEIDEKPSKTSENEDMGISKVLPDTGSDMKENIREQESQKEANDGNKNEEIIKCPVDNIHNENGSKGETIDVSYQVKQDSTSNEVVNNQSKCVEKINRSNYTEKGTLNLNEVLVIPDLNGELEQYFLNLKPYIEEEKVKTAIEVLYLSLEEAFFLSYACNCLQIFDLTSNVLQIRDMWLLFQESQPDFIEKYVAYHYFRAKGWVVKSGTKFGGDFCK